MRFKPQPMVNWYDIGLLVSTGLKTVLSGIFGNFADKREIQAAIKPDESFFDRSEVDGMPREDIWIDYISDLGDGFNATYTMANLLAQNGLQLDSHQTKRGDILIMGGDEVYPTPEQKEYDNRLKGPYAAAFPWKDNDPSRPELFAIPGNHDWYDGLTNFIRNFCQGRAIGNWKTSQGRSYFAIKLPHNYWLLGIDIQFNADIDSPQKDFFRKIAKEDLQKGDKVILCTAEPTWVYKSWSRKNTSDNRVRYFIDHIIHGVDENYYGGGSEKTDIVAVLTGDLHHYSRYVEKFNGSGKECQLITAGGGGAFTHPTHLLKDTIESTTSKINRANATFPSKSESAKLSWRNLAFPFLAISMTIFLGFFHLLTTWFIQSSASGNMTFMECIVKIQDWRELADLIYKTIIHSPSVILLNLILFVGIIFFTDTKTGKGKLNYIWGFIHASIQLVNLYVMIWLFSELNHGWFAQSEMVIDHPLRVLVFSIIMIFVGGFISSFIFGIYLLFSALVVKNHPTESFSSFRWSGYKNFIRIHIQKDSIHFYPVGVKKVVSNWKPRHPNGNKPAFSGDEIQYTLIENPFPNPNQ